MQSAQEPECPSRGQSARGHESVGWGRTRGVVPTSTSPVGGPFPGGGVPLPTTICGASDDLIKFEEEPLETGYGEPL